MKTFVNLFLLVLISFVFYTTASADEGAPGHSHSSVITEAQASDRAVAELQSLIKKEKLSADWEKAAVKKTEQFGSVKDWVVQFENREAKDSGKKNLFVIMSAEGVIKAVNFSGTKQAHSHGSGPAHAH